MNIVNPYDEVNSEEVLQKYFYGIKNRLIRYYFYLRQGLQLFNEFKYLVAGILAVAIWINYQGFLVLTGIFIAASIGLTITGYFWTFHGSKTDEYISIKFASHFNQYNIQMQERQLAVLEDLAKEIKKLK